MRGRIAAARSLLLGLTGLGLGLLGAAQCTFAPDLTTGGTLKCGAAGECPEGHSCTAAGYCCKPDDTRSRCTGMVQPPDGGVPDMVGPVDMVTPPPTDVEPNPTLMLPRKLVGGVGAHLVGFDEGCTRGIPASTPDRWCGFTRGTELWVLNVSKAAKGPVPCNGSDPGCRLLTNKHFVPVATTKTNTHAKTKFFGDLLIYYAEATQDIPSDAAYRGGVFGWHPSFAEPRRMTSATGFSCESHVHVSAPTAWCFDVSPAGAADIRAGVVKAGEPLPLLWTLGTDDRFVVEVNRAGDRLMFMQKLGTALTRALFLIPAAEAADATKRVMVAPNIWNFDLSTDGTAAYIIPDEGRKGALFSVDTATGTKVTPIAPSIEGVGALADDRGTDLGLVMYDAFVGETGNARLIFDRTNPAAAVGLGRVGSVGVSPNKAYTLIASQVVTAPSRLYDAKVFDNATSTSCVLNAAPTTQRTFPFFSASSKLVYWVEPSPEPEWENVWVATSKCAGKRMVTGQLLAFNGLPNDAIIYKQRNATQSSIHYQRFNPDTGASVVGPVLIHQGVGLMSVIEPDRKLAVFSSTANGNEGIFVVDLP